MVSVFLLMKLMPTPIFMFVDRFVMFYSKVSSQECGPFVLLSFSCFIINLGGLHRHYIYNMYFANIFP